uniref:Uncharacterized protein n=1 Tax=Parascaris equorum TaxID=6256 RepID=A0A914S9B3_PAREQ
MHRTREKIRRVCELDKLVTHCAGRRREPMCSRTRAVRLKFFIRYR